MEKTLANFVLPYIAMVPSANLLGFASREMAAKLPRVLGVLLETTFGSVVELILLVVLLRRGDQNIPVIKGAVLGSILANLLLCLGLCFFVGGLMRVEQKFHEAISETGNGLLQVAASKVSRSFEISDLTLIVSGFGSTRNS
jgi:Ca2+:H+ antiporter